MMKMKELYDLNHTMARKFLEQFEYPWQALDGIGQMILDLASNLDDEYEQIADQVWVHKSTQIAKTANLNGPCIIGAKTEVRPGAFIRGNALVGENCVVGNSTELKNVILFDHVQVPHYNYVGDSILGHYAHMGAGSITSNVKSDKSLVVINDRSHRIKIETGRKKVGAMLGNHVEVGCNSVLNPGTVIGCETSIYPLSCVRGVIPEKSIFKSQDDIVIRKDLK